MKTMIYKNKKNTFLNKFLLATSSIGLLASMESFAVTVVSNPGAGNISYSAEPYRRVGVVTDWVSNNGTPHQLQNGDNIILRRANRIDFNSNISINNINIYGYNADTRVQRYDNGIAEEIPEGGITITGDYDEDRTVNINNIINVYSNEYRDAGQNPLGQPLVYGNNDAKVRIDLKESMNEVNLIITGKNISGVSSIVMDGGTGKLIFRNPIKINTNIYARNTFQGSIKIENDGIVFESTIGNDGVNNHAISRFIVDNKRSVTLESKIVAEDIILGQESIVILDSTKQKIDVQAGFGRNNAGDSHGKIRLIERGKGVVFKEQIG